MVQRITSWLGAALIQAVVFAIVPLAIAAGTMYAVLVARRWGMAFHPWNVAIFVGVSAAILVLALILAATVTIVARTTNVATVVVLLLIVLAVLGAIAAGVWYLVCTSLRESWLYSLPFITVIALVLAGAAALAARKGPRDTAPPTVKTERRRGGSTKA